MSRLGKTPIPLPKGVEISTSKDGAVSIKGPKGQLELQLPPGLKVKSEGQVVVVECDEKAIAQKAFFGLFRSLIKNNVHGVSEGYEVKLTLIGVGYRANVQGQKLDLQLGFSHPTWVDIPKTIQVVVEKGTSVSIKGVDKKEVGQFAATVRAMKPPEPYKGKGIRYENEYVRKKEGKAAKGKA
ncbi:MAG: 50S ribosomal protein L6 [Chlamydiae bacterium CG10_big_fil_rev_8_21_14_0_10_42_34]|nr:MAG: 50S ribosomal protein L6 [Chlamydiae bacterium CG10_big_fil_rev_8_21_14_0_10_42_34]